MTSWKYIIADSGGSSTTWVFCRKDGSVKQLETRSMHPKFLPQWTATDWEELATLLGDVSTEKLYFYGAGCSQINVQQQLIGYLKQLGFATIEVFPDTLAACRALCQSQKGTVAILGTGSVLLEYDGKAITSLIGGYGSLIGDEGSGFHFARLVLNDYLHDCLKASEQTTAALAERVGSKTAIRSRLASIDSQAWVATLGKQFTDLELNHYHELNFTLFLATHFPQLKNSANQLAILGSYGFSNRHLFKQLLEDQGWELVNSMQNPLEELVHFHKQNG